MSGYNLPDSGRCVEHKIDALCEETRRVQLAPPLLPRLLDARWTNDALYLMDRQDHSCFGSQLSPRLPREARDAGRVPASIPRPQQVNLAGRTSDAG